LLEEGDRRSPLAHQAVCDCRRLYLTIRMVGIL
jgi:hypothetical protein